jgi:hypothetical protein
MPFQIREIVACVAIDPNDPTKDEGIMAAPLGNTLMPLMASDEARLASIIPVAEHIKRITGMDYRVLRFTGREDMTTEALAKYKPEPK